MQPYHQPRLETLRTSFIWLCTLFLTGSLVLLGQSTVWAQPGAAPAGPSVTTLPAPATDSHAVLEAGSVVSVNNIGDTVGFTSAGAERVIVMVFELPAAPPNSVVSAVFGPNVNSVGNPRGGAPYNVELSVVGIRDSKDVQASDFGASATLIQADFLNPGQPSSTSARFSPSAAGKAALTAYLQSNYAAGKFIFLRYKVPAGTTAQDFDSDSDLYSGYNISMEGHFNAWRRPTLSISFLACTDRVYVDASAGGANDGSSWNDAFTNLQDALTWKAACSALNQIWVADGVYYPDQGSGQTDNDRNATFRLIDGVALYGGFAGGESDLNQRDPATNVTILSGDLAQDDTNTDGNHIAESWTDLQGENAHHVLFGDNVGNGAVVDGFTITGGNTDGSGGGMLLQNSGPTLNAIIFRGNQARDGGGLYSYLSSPLLTDVTFHSNHGTAFGGGMSTRDAGTASLNAVVFDGNRAGESGGGIDNNTSSPNLTNVTFRNNTAGSLAGGANVWNSQVSFTGVTFHNNQAGKGGAVRQGGGSTATYTNTTFSGNQASQEGGALYQEEGDVHLRHVTVADNNAPAGSALSVISGALDLSNTLIAAGTGSRACQGAVTSLGHNLGTDSSCKLTKSTDLVRANPKLAPLADNGGPTQTRELQAGSAAVNKGDCVGGAITADQRGITRPVGAACDIGAFEFTGPIVYDYGDAPDPTYPTLKANNGARHGQLSARKLGATADDETDGQPTANADGDGADDDGVTLPAELTICEANPIIVNAGAEGRLFAWVDFNADGDWQDAGERIFYSELLRAGNNDLAIFVPCDAKITDGTFLRFRFSGDLKLAADGTALDGEVEDYKRPIRRGPPNAVDDWQQGQEDTEAVIPVLDNDSDKAGTITLADIARQPTNGTATVDGSSVRFVPKANWSGTDSFEYTIRNDINLTAKATVQLVVLAVNDPPADIGLSETTVDALKPLNTPVGTVSVTDADTNDSHTLQLSGPDASAFALNGNILNRAIYFNPAKQNSYAITLWATDRAGASFSKDLTLTIVAAEPVGPKDLAVNGDRIDENRPADTTVGTLSARDPRNLGLTYSLVNGAGDTHNSFFKIDGDQLKTTKELDFEATPTASIRVQVTNGVDDPAEFVLLVKVIDDPNEPPPLANCSGADIPVITSNDGQTEVTVRDVQVANPSNKGCEVTGKLFVRIPGGSQASNIDFKGRVDSSGKIQSNDGQVGDSIGDFRLDPAGPEWELSGSVIEYYVDRPSLRIKQGRVCLPGDLGGGCINLPGTVTLIIDSNGLNFGGSTLGNSSSRIPMPSMALSKSGVGIAEIYGNYKRVANGYEFTAGGTFNLPRFASGRGCGITVIVTIYKDSSGVVHVRIEEPPLPLAVDQVNGTRLSELTLGYQCSPGIPIGSTGLELTGVSGTISLRPDNTFVQLSVAVATSAKVPVLGYPLAQLNGGTTVFIQPEWGVDFSVNLELLSLIEVAKAQASIRKGRFSTRVSFNAVIITGEAGVDIWTSSGTRIHFTGRGSITVNIPKGVVTKVCAPYPCGYCHNPKGWKPWHCHPRICTKCTGIPPREVGTPKVGADFGEFSNGAYGFKGYAEVFSKQFGFYVDTQKRLKIGGVSGYTLATPPAIAAALLQEQARMAADKGLMSLDPRLVDDRYSFVSATEVLISVPSSPVEPAIAASTGISQVTVSGPTDLLFTLNTDPGVTMTLVAPGGMEITADNFNTTPVSPTYKVGYTAQTLFEPARPTVDAEASMARVRFMPISLRTEMQSMDVRVDGATLVTGIGIDIDAIWDYVLLQPGDHVVEFVTSAGGAHVISQTVTVEIGKSYTLIAAGKDAPSLHWIEDNNSVPGNPSQGLLRIIQSAQIAESVHVRLDGELVVNGAGFGAVSGYIPVQTGDRLLEIQDAATGADLAPPAIIQVEAASIHSLYLVDWTADGYTVDWGQIVDESYIRQEYTQFSVDQAVAGDWKVKLTGNLTDTDYLLLVNGIAAPTAVSDVTAQVGAPDRVDVDLTLRSDFIPVTITAYLSPEPITTTFTYTDNNGSPVSTVEPNYTGFAAGTVTVTSAAQAQGGAVQMQLDTSTVPSGQYHVWVRADNVEMPPGSAFANQPGASIPALITVDHSATFPTAWTTPITATLNRALLSLDVRWDVSGHPDVDYYNLLIGTRTLSYTQVISNLVQMYSYDSQGRPAAPFFGQGIVSNMRPGITYYIAVEAVDEESGRTVRSQEKTVSFLTGDYTISTPAKEYVLQRDQVYTIPVTIDPTSPLFFDNVALGLTTEGLAPGILAYFEDSLETPPMVDTTLPTRTLNLIVEARAGVPDGAYELVINGYNALDRERHHRLTFRVGRGFSFYLPWVGASQQVFADDFDEGVGAGWSVTRTSTAPAGAIFLGEFGNETVSLDLSGLPPHKELLVSFDLYIIRSWDGNQVNKPVGFRAYDHLTTATAIGPDIWQLGVDGTTVITTTFSNWDGFRQAYPDAYPGGNNPARTGAASTNQLGYTFGEGKDAIYRLSIPIAHTGDTARIDFSALGLQAIEDESWGLDNIRVVAK